LFLAGNISRIVYNEYMKQITKYVGMVAIMAIFALATVSGSIGQADAVKAQGEPGSLSGPNSFGSANADIVCGASLCSESDATADPVNQEREQ